LKLEFSAKLSWLGEERKHMKASKFTEAQKAFILKQGEQGTPVAEICGKAGISQATYFNWKKKYGGLLPDEMRRLKALEDENTRLKKIVADLTLDREMLQDVIRRKLVLWIQEASAVLEATARHAIYGVQWRRLDRKALGLFKDRFRV